MSSAGDQPGSTGPDAAGGEAIYSSDGLPPLPAPAPPVRSGDGGEDAVLDSEGVTPAAAFEVFGGKAYLRPSQGGGGRRAADASAEESPLVRLARLTAEVAELERDLQASAAAGGAGGERQELQLGGARPEELARLAQELSARLGAAGNAHGVVGGGAAFRGQQEGLSRLVRDEISRAPSGSPEAAAEAPAGGSGVVYELHASASAGHGGAPGEAGMTAASAASLEERLGKIERAVGSRSSLASVASGSKSVLERLQEVEKMAARADSKALAASAAKAKVIRADLEAAAKAKSKLSSALSTLSADDAKVISSLHGQLEELEGVSSHLPAIVSRLQDLSSLHVQAADFSSRLASVENAAADAERLLRGVEDALGAVEEGWRSNAEAMEKNLAALDERTKGASS